MKQVAQNYKTGRIGLEEVAVPALKPGGVLVRMHYSVISAGTEGMKVREGKMSYLGKARARPDKLKQVFDSLQQQGLLATYRKVMNKLDTLTPLGYSGAGEVVEVGSDASGFYVGQRVACGGAGYCNHAEYNFIPSNLAVPVPDNVSLKYAAFATVGAIALQGFRRAQPQLGETACVIGLGLLGQLLVQILTAAGVRTVGVDLKPQRCELAVRSGAYAALQPEDPALQSTVAHLTDGFGVDVVFIAAGGSSNVPVELAAQLARDRARVVDIGKTRLDLPLNEYYLKELDVRFSRSYGPGRYDPQYEERGIDYPIGYVRWTERRNMAAFLDLLASGRINLDPIVSAVRPFTEAEQVYEEIATGKSEALGTVFEYDVSSPPAMRIALPLARASVHRSTHDRVRLGVIGAGNYASSMLLPHLQQDERVILSAVATTSSLTGENARRKFGFLRATTNYAELLADEEIDAVLIATRHSSHARIVCEALRAGKAVFVEKPLALSIEQLEEVERTIAECGNDRLMVGFNRRFSPMVRAIEGRTHRLATPLVLHYRVHAGQLEPGSWYLDSSEGSRFVGEAGHFFDVMSYLAGSRPIRVFAMTLLPRIQIADDHENIAATVQYENGSVGNLLYLTQGGAKVPKELLEVFGGGTTARLENFEELWFFDSRHRNRAHLPRGKGQAEELSAFLDAVRSGGAMPIPLESLFDTTASTLAALESIHRGAPCDIRSIERWQVAADVVGERRSLDVAS